MDMIKGKYATAHIFAKTIEPEAVKQIQHMLDSPACEGTKVAIMPDVHAGKGSTIGTVVLINDRVVPNMVSVDIGCGVLAINIGERNMYIDFEKLHAAITHFIPSGRNINKERKAEIDFAPWRIAFSLEEKDYFNRSIGSLGGGNHFISIESGETGTWLLIHSGSRKLGGVVAKHYQDLAIKNIKKVDNKAIIEQLKHEGRQDEIEGMLRDLNINKPSIDSELAFLQGEDMKNYLNDMLYTQRYAAVNRVSMATSIMKAMHWKIGEVIESVHNYIDTERNILRKGAVAAYMGEPFLVPLNMRDGTLIYYVEKEQPEWLFSAPHGAGRAMSRTQAKANLDMVDFTNAMRGIWSASVHESTLDEAPGAYKPAEEIEAILSKVYTKVDHLEPIFNFKAEE